MSRSISVVFSLTLAFVAASAQPTDPAPPETFLEQYAATYRFRLGNPASIRVVPGGGQVLFLRSGPRSFVRDLYEVDVATGRERRLLTAEALLGGSDENLTAEERARRERQRLAARGIVSYEISKDGSWLLVPLSGRLFVVERKTGEHTELESEAGPAVDPQISPDGRYVACVRGGELHVTERETGKERRLTHDAGGSVTNGLAEFVAQEEMSRHHGYWWSPDSGSLVYQQTDTSALEVMHILDATRPERSPQSWPYPRPGHVNASVRVGIVPVSGGPTRWIEWDSRRHEYLTQVRWTEGAPLTLGVQDRRQTEIALLTVDPRDGSTAPLHVERDAAWIDIDERMPVWLPDGSGFLWTSERDGVWRLELRAPDGSLRRHVTPEGFGFRRFVQLDVERGQVVVSASDDSARADLWRLPLDPASGAPRQITRGPGSHGARFERDETVWVHHAIPLDRSESWRILRGDEPTGASLRSVAETPPFTPRIELTRVGSDPSLRAVLVRPRDFDPALRYPVINHVYGGPTSVMVRAAPSRYLLDQWLADQGFIVVSIDGRGTPHRGRDWLRAVRGDLSSVPLTDQARGIRLLAERYPELDPDRVGIYGWSFGGYLSAMAVLRAPEIFRAGVAGAPVVDWADYDTHYTERYMGLPEENPEGYRAANVLSYADRLDRPLLVIHGTADDNVYFSHSLKLADALFRSGRTFEFLPLPGFTHMVPDPLVTSRLYARIAGFLEGHLGQPRRPTP